MHCSPSNIPSSSRHVRFPILPPSWISHPSCHRSPADSAYIQDPSMAASCRQASTLL
ncbi:hypothetical protein BD413DRAFT_497181 [Trametes elegans]|nr:hypothetical protein BD413DRAFT_497181 [Trametes elegans]